MSGTAPLRSVAVVGGGVVAATAALAFARALPTAAVMLVATPVDPAALADRFPTTPPSGASMLERLGIDEAALVARGIAHHRLAQRFGDWSRDRRPWLVAEGSGAAVGGPGALHQRWLEAARVGEALAFHDLSPAAVLAQAGRYTPPADGPLTGADHALALDAVAFRAVLIDALRRTAARVGEGQVGRVDRDARGGVAAMRLADGASIAADLFIDATGPAALLAGDGPFRDWSTFLPADRMLVAADRDAAPSLLDDYLADEIGWFARWSRPAGVRVQAYAAAVTGEERARRMLAAGPDAANRIDLRPERREEAWTGNLLTLGEAAAQHGPLGNAGFGHALSQIALALELLPGRDMEPALLAEYNRRTALRADRLCDFLAAHYLAGGRRQGAFWRASAGGAPPPGLAKTLAQYARRGLLPHHDEESVNPAAWHALLLGQGMRPERRDPVAMGGDPHATAAALRAASATISASAERLPLYRDYLAHGGGIRS